MWRCVSDIAKFRMMRNSHFSEKALLDSVRAQLESRLPAGWRTRINQRPRRGREADALITIRAPDGTESVLAVEAKRSVEAKDVPFLLDRLLSYTAARPFVIAPFISPRTREQLADRGAGYADLTGNLRLVLDRPAAFIETVGAKSSPWREERPLRSLKGPTAGRVVRALCDFRPPYGVRELAGRSGASAASVSRVVDLLEREALVSRASPRGAIEAVAWPEILRRWVDDYSLIGSNRTATFLAPRGVQPFIDNLTQLEASYAVTGSLAGSQVAPVAPTRLIVVYVDDIEQVSAALGVRPAEAGANVILAEPFDPVVFDRTWVAGGVTLAALSQVAADLLTSPGRGPAEAEELVSWMEKNENAWRS
jgi:hypothetical protein